MIMASDDISFWFVVLHRKCWAQPLLLPQMCSHGGAQDSSPVPAPLPRYCLLRVQVYAYTFATKKEREGFINTLLMMELDRRTVRSWKWSSPPRFLTERPKRKRVREESPHLTWMRALRSSSWILPYRRAKATSAHHSSKLLIYKRLLQVSENARLFKMYLKNDKQFIHLSFLKIIITIANNVISAKLKQLIFFPLCFIQMGWWHWCGILGGAI